MKIFVAGGTGAIGRPLIAALLAKGHALAEVQQWLQRRIEASRSESGRGQEATLGARPNSQTENLKT